MHQRTLPDAREVSFLLSANHVKVMCVYHSGGLCQEGDDVEIYLARPRKPSHRQRVCGTWEEGKEVTRVAEYQEATSEKLYTRLLIHYRLGWVEENEICTSKRCLKMFTQGAQPPTICDGGHIR
jgi:hypothetical protein